MAAAKGTKKQTTVEVFLEVTDTPGKPLLIMPQEQVLRHKLRHKAVIVCLRNARGQIFLHKHPPQAATAHSGLWNLAASGKVFAGESCYDAALRCLETELGVTDLELHAAARFEASPQTDNAQTTLFLTTKSSVLPCISEYGQQNGMFVDQEELGALLRDFPHLVTPLLQLALPYLF